MILTILDLRHCILTFTMFSILNSYNNGSYIESRPRLLQLISKYFKSYASLNFEQAQAKAANVMMNNKNSFPLDVVQCCLLFPTQLTTGTPLPCSVLILSMAKNQSDSC